MWFAKGDDDAWARQDALRMQLRAEFAEEIRKLRIEMEARLKPLPPEYGERLADTEVKIARLWGLLVKTTPTGQDRLTKHGRLFGGLSRGNS